MELRGEQVIKTVVGYRCDVCGKEDSNMESITAQHYQWGNDSIESVTVSHACSPECYKKQIIVLFDHVYYRDTPKSYINDIPMDYWKYFLNKENNGKV